MRTGDRVLKRDGLVGHVEALGEFVRVRWLTHDGLPSCAVSSVDPNDLVVVPESVKPSPITPKWWERSAEFLEAIRTPCGNLE